VCEFVEFLAVPCEEDAACARTVANADDISLDVGRSKRRWCEGLVETAVAS
jgi:hypothetical protein